MEPLSFPDVARLPSAGDNVAIATRRLAAGTRVRWGGVELRLDGTVMEGHRFAVAPIARGEPLRSWGLPFGAALVDIAPGAYVCNQGMLEALADRRLDFALPAGPNFEDRSAPFRLDAGTFRPGVQVARHEGRLTFAGYDRGRRGAGTRNYLVVLGTTCRTAAFARILAARLEAAARACRNLDGVVAVAHTEGGGRDRPNNEEFLLRVLAGFAVHPNVAGVLAVDYGGEAVPNRRLRAFLQEGGYPLADGRCAFLSIDGGLEAALARGEGILRAWLPAAEAVRRTACGLQHLKVALQCGGSDAFSGVSGNPLAAWVAREVIRWGGSANLAETDELIGAEPYVLANVRDPDTAQRFLDTVARFVERVGWHGVTAEGNPSGGNRYRGLYNIALKSIGAAMKRHPEVRLDQVVGYGEPMAAPGYYFMDSPGNDLESIAGQVAAGCNLILFVTGNGSVTNFPFVPTLKILTTTARFQLLREDMDVNAGQYLDGTPMEELGRRTFELALATAGGEPTRGERAGHSQVSIWRDWPQSGPGGLEALRRQPVASGRPLALRPAPAPGARYRAIVRPGGHAIERVGLVLPASLCSAEIARLAAARLEARGVGRAAGVARFAALAHTEGCGVSGGPSEEIYARLLLGYLTHPLAHAALLLEHGCEKTHNDYLRSRLARAGLDPERYGWASVQLDGGIARSLDRVEAWFAARLAAAGPPEREAVGLEALRLGVLAAGPLPAAAAAAIALLARWVVGAGGTVVVGDGILAQSPELGRQLQPAAGPLAPNLLHGEVAAGPGLHVMAGIGEPWVEALTGLAASGVEIIVGHAGEHALAGHPLVPVVQVSAAPEVIGRFGADLDVVLPADAAAAEDGARALLDGLLQVASGAARPRLAAQGLTGFQISRGPLGVSL